MTSPTTPDPNAAHAAGRDRELIRAATLITLAVIAATTALLSTGKISADVGVPILGGAVPVASFMLGRLSALWSTAPST